jgi:hypothetical protein
MISISLHDGVRPKVRPLHGVNLAAPIVNATVSKRISDDLRLLGIPLTRLHDAPLDNPGMRLVDVPCVFPNPYADPSDPKNYYFDQTDDYIQNALNYGTRIMYRLGVSIEHSEKHYWTKPPADIEKWCNVCQHIVEHYPDIEYWEIGNECDEEIPQLWDGTWRQFIDLYVKTSRHIKTRFPHLKVGGPSMARLNNHEGQYVRDFLAACREEKAPLDFFSWHQYSDKPEKIIAAPREVKALLDEYGFSRAELHLSEWHYHPGWGSGCTPERQSRAFESMIGVDAATYLGAVLTGWQDTPITMGHYYTGSTLAGYPGYALFGQGGVRTAGYFTMELFHRLTQQEHGLRFSSSDASTWVLGAATGNRLMILISSFKTPQNDVTINVGNRVLSSSKCKVTVLDPLGGPHVVDHDLRWEPHQVTLEKSSGSAVIFLELEST